MNILLLLLMVFLPQQSEPDFASVKKAASEQHKLILLNFSGSDWCAPCILFKRDYLTDEFTQLSKDRLIFLNADFPRRKKNQLPANLVSRNEALAETYNKEGSFPLTLLLDAGGNILKIWKGKPQADPQEWLAEVKLTCDKYK